VTPKIYLDSPCKTEGPRFEERDDGRFCHQCQEMQYDLRDATRAEVVALMRSKGGRICGRLRLGPSGEPRFKPEPPPRAMTVLRSAAVAATLAACGSPSEPTVTPEPTVAAPPPSSATPIAAPPSSVAEAPPTAVAPVDPPAPDDPAIDHSTDASPHLADHQRHRHTHPLATIGDGTGGSGLVGTMPDVGYGGGLAFHPGGGGSTGVVPPSGGSLGGGT
jgi:hypothetical protein